jgi:hypothetical protein
LLQFNRDQALQFNRDQALHSVVFCHVAHWLACAGSMMMVMMMMVVVVVVVDLHEWLLSWTVLPVAHSQGFWIPDEYMTVEDGVGGVAPRRKKSHSKKGQVGWFVVIEVLDEEVVCGDCALDGCPAVCLSVCLSGVRAGLSR